jgi:hypothetical protein
MICPQTAGGVLSLKPTHSLQAGLLTFLAIADIRGLRTYTPKSPSTSRQSRRCVPPLVPIMTVDIYHAIDCSMSALRVQPARMRRATRLSGANRVGPGIRIVRRRAPSIANAKPLQPVMFARPRSDSIWSKNRISGACKSSYRSLIHRVRGCSSRIERSDGKLATSISFPGRRHCK